MSKETLGNGESGTDVPVSQETEVLQDETVSSEAENSESSAETDAEQHKPPRGVQKRLDQLTREKYEERREREKLSALVEKQAQMLEMALRQQQAPAQRNDGPPSPDDFSAGRFDPDYIEALTDYKAQKAANNLFERQKQEAARNQYETQANETRNTIARKEVEFGKAHGDYEDVKRFLLADDAIANHQGIGAAIMQSENPPALLYHLGKNPDLAYKIAGLDPIRAAAELGRIEERLSRPALKPVSQAPAPAAQVSQGGALPTTELSQAKDFKEWLAIREAQIKAKQGR